MVDARDGASLAAKVAFLSQPESYPGHCTHVERIETHFSWVFLTDRHAYKLKKPVHDDLVDLRTLEARRRNCIEEVRLNRRFAAGVYQAVLPLAVDRYGSQCLGDGGQTTDWLVRMRRLPARRMLDHVIARGELDDRALASVVDLLCRVYEISGVPISEDAYRERLAGTIDRNERELCRREFELPVAAIQALCAAQRRVLDARPVFDRRVRLRRIVEGHGDLRPEHVCLEPQPVIIDSLEFSRDLRVADAVDEIAFLALECERLGAPAARTVLLREYARVSGDRAADLLVDFYQSLRATVRARLAIRHLLDEAVAERTRWTAAARRYLDLARRHADAAQAGTASPIAM